MGTEANKQLVRRLVEEVVNERNAEPLDELAGKEFAGLARRWISPFRGSFPDFRMEIVELVAEDDTDVAHLKCSGTHTGEWLGVAPTGRRFEGIDEIYSDYPGPASGFSWTFHHARVLRRRNWRLRTLGPTGGG
jgi:hypothetical protein